MPFVTYDVWIDCILIFVMRKSEFNSNWFMNSSFRSKEEDNHHKSAVKYFQQNVFFEKNSTS